MAITINTIPTLKGKEAKAFTKEAYANYSSKKETIDFSKQIKSTKKILAKAKLKETVLTP